MHPAGDAAAAFHPPDPPRSEHGQLNVDAGNAAAETRAQQQAAVAAFGVRALSEADLATLFQEAAELVARTLDTPLVKVVEVLPDGTSARLVAGTGWRDGLVGTATITIEHDSQAGYALRSHQPVIVDDLHSDPRVGDPPLLREHGVVSGLSVVLYGTGRSAYGVLGAHSTRPRRFGAEDVSFLQGVANVLSAAMQRRHMEDTLRRAQAEAEAYATQLQEQAFELEHQSEEAQALAEELEVTNARLQDAADRAGRLLAISAGLSATSTPEDVGDVIFREGLAAIGADAGSLALAVYPASDAGTATELQMVRTTGYPESIATRYQRFPLTPGRPVSDAVITRTPRLLGSWAEWRRAYPDTEADVGTMGYEAFAAIPVLGGGRVLAALSASFRRPVQFDDATRTFLATLGEQCGLALERARAYDAERRARAASAFLAEASQLLAASLDYATTLKTVAEASVPRLGDWCAVDLVRDPTAPTWPPKLERVAIVHQDPAKLALGAALAERYPTDWSAEAGMAGVIRDGTPLFVPTITDAMLEVGARDAEHLALLRALDFSSIIVVPLVARGRTLGALTLCHTESGRRYDDADLALAQDLAQRAALAVDNARLYRDAESARQAAEQARQTAEKANRGKSQFLATMSHELRTPLNAIAGYTELLSMELRGPVTDAQREDLERIHRAQHHLLGLINDVLNYARIESGRVEFDVRPVDLRDVVRDVRPMVEPQLAAKGLDFDVRWPEDIASSTLLVWADREKLAQVLLNLLSNAVKFTPATRDGVTGRVTIELLAVRSAPGGALEDAVADLAMGDQVYLRVADTGIGIPADRLEAVFEPFVQVHSEFTRQTGGTGLGLAISRDLARGMGGDLRVRSTEGVGTAFTVTLRRVSSASGEPVDRRTGDERRDEEARRSGEDRRSSADAGGAGSSPA
jgi:signal transduction histidine kinase